MIFSAFWVLILFYTDSQDSSSEISTDTIGKYVSLVYDIFRMILKCRPTGIIFTECREIKTRVFTSTNQKKRWKQLDRVATWQLVVQLSKRLKRGKMHVTTSWLVLFQRMAWVLWINHWAKKAKPIEFRFAFNTRWKIVLIVVYSFYKTVFLFCRVLIGIISILQLFINCYYLGLGERILREEKEMRDMKSRLLAIEAELQTLYRETGNESEVSNNY